MPIISLIIIYSSYFIFFYYFFEMSIMVSKIDAGESEATKD